MSDIPKDALPDGMTEEDLEELLKLVKGTKAYRTYDLIMVDGEPQFVLSELDQILKQALDEAYGKKDED